jgi:hypothetical protein
MATTKTSTPTTIAAAEEGAMKEFQNKLHRLPPTNLYKDARDMNLVSFLIYVWGRVVTVLHDELPKDDGKQKSWSPAQVKHFILQHKQDLIDEYPEMFQDGSLTYSALDVLIQRSPNRELALTTWDSDFQTKELVFGVCRDSTNRRVTLVFRGTETAMAFKSNWATNLDIGQTPEEIPGSLKAKLRSGNKRIWIHSGFHGTWMK